MNFLDKREADIISVNIANLLKDLKRFHRVESDESPEVIESVRRVGSTLLASSLSYIEGGAEEMSLALMEETAKILENVVNIKMKLRKEEKN